MRGAASTMKLLRPRTPEEAVRLYGLRQYALPLAGGTDLMVAWNMGLLNGKTILDLSRLDEWKGIREGKGSLTIGSLATHAQIRRDPRVRKALPLLAGACSSVGAAQIQNRGTIGGNIANASPAGDTFPSLAVYEAVIHTVSPEGGRILPILDVFTGVKTTSLRASELIESVEVPSPRRPTRRIYRKVGTRAAQAISKTVAAGLLWLGPGKKVTALRFALGSMAPTVRRLRTVEAFLEGKRMTPSVVTEACSLLSVDVSPIDDVRSTRDYRLTASKNILRSFLIG